MKEEIHEMHEHAEHAHHDRTLRPVTFTMALLAVFLAAVSLLGHRAHTEELLLQNRATDQWAFFQAKNIRRSSYELFLDLLSVANLKDAEAADKIREKYSKEVERYRGEQKEIEAEARALEKEVEVERRKANRFDLGEVCLEAAIVITSLTLLTRQRMFLQLGIFAGALGLCIAVTGFWVH